ncbi:MAG: hypothetical protein LN412_01515, partial [Candidatus Thermoplasmatota archaeon]|nr:hypothetical protein [Candidatus Thermoplasmatota archaeon]
KLKTLCRDRDGVASTVGTIMALLVILTFFSLFINSYVPVWSKEAEAAHMSTVLGHFGSFKSSIDGQILSAQIASSTGSTYIPTETYSPIQLGTDGIPVFASPTVGRMNGDGDDAPWSVQFSYNIDSTPYTVNETAAGSVVLQVDNRYHVPFTIAYEGGGILMSQSAGQALRVDPQLSILNTTNGVEIALVLVQLIGSGNVAGSGTEGIRSKLIALDMQEFTKIQGSLWINHTTTYGPAWFGHLNNTLSLAFGVLDSDFAANPDDYIYNEAGGQTVETPYYILSRSQSNLTHTISLEIINGSPGRPIVQLTLHHAFVSIAVGRSSSTLEV